MKHESTYTGTYELEFLRFLDEVMNFNPEDVMTLSPYLHSESLDGYLDYPRHPLFQFPDSMMV